MQRYKEKSKKDKETLIHTPSSTSESFTSSESLKEITERVEQLEKLLAASKLNSLTSLDRLSFSSESGPTLYYAQSHEYLRHVDSFQSGPSCSYGYKENTEPNEEKHINKNRTHQSFSPDLFPKPFQQTCQAYDQFTNVRRMPANRQPTVYRKEQSRQAPRSMDVEREYKNYDTLHYLAQGEFAPVDDGVKLTPSREAVLSDIIWEDVCRAHWPNIRLVKKSNQRKEKLTARNELQRQIDSLLRERSARAEKRKRRQLRTKINGFDQNRNGNHGYMLCTDTNTAVSTRKYTSDDCVMIDEINKRVSPDRHNDLRCFQRPTGSLDISNIRSRRFDHHDNTESRSRKLERAFEANNDGRERKQDRIATMTRVEKRVQNVEAMNFPHPVERRVFRSPELVLIPDKKSEKLTKRTTSPRRQGATSLSVERHRKRNDHSRTNEHSVPRSKTPVSDQRERSTQYQRKSDSYAGPSNSHKHK